MVGRSTPRLADHDMSKSRTHRHENTDLAQAMRELRRSNAAGTHEDRRTRRNRSRSERDRRAIADAMS